MQEVFAPLMDDPKPPTPKPLPPLQEPVPCPRCDSTNTKFCYYNNYNLTQPRHFCKTCRRYWTKGGALRNVPIGGGCRKAKVMPTICSKSVGTKGKIGVWSHELAGPAGPIAWSAPHTAQLVALLRETTGVQNPNPNLGVPSFLNGLDSLYGHGQFSSYAMPHQQVPRYQTEPVFGTQEMYQRIKTNLSCNDQLQAVVGNVAGFGSTNGANVQSSVMETAPLTGGEVGYWSQGLDMQSANGSFN
ncbi:hypothetical protein LUZ60_004978 [Juncus effusus]|nr:hypothetical protein LUZ60_004978 [Juncus effusus]